MSEISTEVIDFKGGKALGVLIEMGTAPLVLIKAPKGFVMCGYLNMQTANRLGDAAALVKGVKSFDDVLNAKVVEVSEKARALGVVEGLSGREALERMI